MELQELDAFVTAATKLKDLLTANPAVLEYMRLAQGREAVVMPFTTDYLVGAREAAKILSCDRNAIYRFVKEGKLTAYYTPDSTRKKFWISELRQLVKAGR